MRSNPQPRTIPKAVVADPATPGAGRLPATPATPVSAANASIAGNAGESRIKKLTIRMDERDIGRARSAWRITCAHRDDYPSFGQWVAELIVAATEQVEAETGSPITPTPAGVIPTGAAAR